MDIREIQPRTTGAADESRGARAVGSSSAPRDTQDSSPDRVTLSARAQAFQEARRAALAVPEVRSDRVEELRSRLGAGTLQPDPDAIARALRDQGLL